ncbi:MAG: hypothetical protein AB7V27_12275 [Candidatus Binatia bacterium]
MRRFSLNPAASRLDLLPDVGAFSGFAGYLELSAGVPDPQTEVARVDVTGASEFLFVAVGTLNFCIKPLVPVQSAGVLSCNGGINLGITSTQDHHLGLVGSNGFTEAECIMLDGFVEEGDQPHPEVCNGPVVTDSPPELDSGPGALLIAPDARFRTAGLPAEVSFEAGPCAQHRERVPTVFGLVSSLSRATILNANAVLGSTFQHDATGENFSCQSWTQENGSGRLVLAVPAVHGAGAQDLITVFTLDD